MLPLLHVLATHSKILTTRPYQQLWAQIAGHDYSTSPHEDYDSLAQAAPVSRCDKEVPLLVQDASCLLIQMVLILPLPLERRHFCCLVQQLFNLVVVQIMAQLSTTLGEKKRKLCKALAQRDWDLTSIMICVLHNLTDSLLYAEEESETGQHDSKGLDVEADIHQPLHQLALHFLRLASLLQFHLFSDTLPVGGSSPTNHEEFVELCSFLNISYEPKFDAGIDPRAVIGRWCNEFLVFLGKSPVIGKGLLVQHKPWIGPRLLTLPFSYDTLFQVTTNTMHYI